MINPSFL